MINIQKSVSLTSFVNNYCETTCQNCIYRFQLPWMLKRLCKLFFSFTDIGQIFSPSPAKNLIFESFKVSSYSHIIVTSTSKVVFALSHNKLRNPLLSSKPAWSFFNIFNYDVACGLSPLEKLPSLRQWVRDGIFSICL